MTVQKIAPEVCEEEFNRILEYYDLDTSDMRLEDDETDESGKKAKRLDIYAEIKSRMIKAIAKGALMVNEEGKPQFTPRFSPSREPLVFSYPTTPVLIEMDKRKDHETTLKMVSGLAGITGAPLVTFSKMDLRDTGVCTAFFTLLTTFAQ